MNRLEAYTYATKMIYCLQWDNTGFLKQLLSQLPACYKLHIGNNNHNKYLWVCYFFMKKELL